MAQETIIGVAEPTLALAEDPHRVCVRPAAAHLIGQCQILLSAVTLAGQVMLTSHVTSGLLLLICRMSHCQPFQRAQAQWLQGYTANYTLALRIHSK